MSSSEVDLVFEALSHKTRREIIRLLGDRGEASYSEMLKKLNLDSGVLNYHLSKLEGLVEKKSGNYGLTEVGYKAYRTLLFAERGADSEAGEKRESIPLIILYSFVSPTLVFRGDNNPHVLTASLVLLTVYLAELIIYVGSPLYALALLSIPLITSALAAYLIYGRTSKTPQRLITFYGFSSAPQILYPPVITVLVALAPARVLEVRAVVSLLVTLAYFAYTLMFVKKVFNLDTSRAAIISMISLATLKYITSALGELDYPCVYIP